MRRICRVLGVARSGLYTASAVVANQGSKPPCSQDELLSTRIKALANQHPTFGYRRLWALVRFGDRLEINIKKVHRHREIASGDFLEVKALHLQVKVRESTPRPRVEKKISRAETSNERWSMDITHVYCGQDGWGHLAAVVDCHDREIVGYEFSLRGRAKETERALEAACLSRFGTVRPAGETPMIRSDNGLVFTRRRFREACQFYRLSQEFITRYTPEQNGLIERFFRSLKEECVWQHNFADFEEARKAIREWIGWYNERRPHQALGYKSPAQYRQQKVLALV